MLSKTVLEFMKIFTPFRKTITSADILTSRPAALMLTARCRLYFCKYMRPTGFVLQNSRSRGSPERTVFIQSWKM